ncbi:MAG: GNAT family N-acetyltransferase [Myxococcaceae bacterium]
MNVHEKPAARALRSPRRRVRLRAPTKADQREFLALARASRKLHRPWLHPPETAATFRNYLRRSREKTFRALLVVSREDGAIVGAFNLSQIFHGPFRNAYLGYWIGAPFAGQGYMTEAMALLLRYAFRTLKLHRVEANVQPGNARSAELLRRTGFRKEGFSPRYLKVGGRWRDHDRWAITVEEVRSPSP